jgi:hypothetical protein
MDRYDSTCCRTGSLLALLLGCAILAGCGGGGGGGGGPTASNVCHSTPPGQTLNGTLPGNGNRLTYAAGSLAPAKGRVTIDVAGNFSYVPETGLPSGDGRARGMDSFSYRATDENGAQTEGVVTVLINGSVRIMPLGDSITTGVSGALAQNLQVGYRRKLYDDLEAASDGYGIDFVGSRNAEGAAATPALPDRDHEGHPGWCDDNNPSCAVSGGQTVDGSITSILNGNPPDIVLLHIGTNEFSTDSSGVNSILNKISAWAQANYSVHVFLARIIPTTNGSLAVNAYNDNVQAIAGDRPGVRVFMVDQQSELRLAGDPDPNRADPALMADNLHPNQAGYERMAGRWRSQLSASGVLPACR